jgi:hypothetical protein
LQAWRVEPLIAAPYIGALLMVQQPTVRRLRMEHTLAPRAAITHIRLATDARGASNSHRKE